MMAEHGTTGTESCARCTAIVLSAILLVSCGRTPQDYRAAADSLRFAAEPLLAQRLQAEGAGEAVPQADLQEQLFTEDNIELLRDALAAETDSVQQQRIRYLLGFFGLRHLRAAITRTGNLENASSAGQADSIARSTGFGSARSLVEFAFGITPEKTTLLTRLTLTEIDSVVAFMHGRAVPPHAESLPQIVQAPASPEIRRFDGMLGNRTREDALVHTFARAGFPLAFVRPPRRPASIAEDSVLFLDCGHDQREMRLTVRPPSGISLADLEALLFRTGVCLHASYTREHALEFRHLGDPAVREAFGFLFRNLAGNQAWLRQHSSMPPVKLKELLEFQSRRDLSHMRRDCETRLDQPDIVGEFPPGGAGPRLRARILEAILDSVLSARFGANWFENPGAYALLKDLWAPGTRFNSEAVALRLGAAGLSPGPWRSRLINRLRFAAR